MAYTPHTWQAREGEGLSIYTDTNTGSVLNLQSTPTSVTQAGTPFSAEWMNEMEQGIEGASTAEGTDVPAATAEALGDTTQPPTVNSALLEIAEKLNAASNSVVYEPSTQTTVISPIGETVYTPQTEFPVVNSSYQQWTLPAYGNGVYVTVASTDGTNPDVAWSTDFSNWEFPSAPQFQGSTNNNNMRCVFFKGKFYVYITATTTTTYIYSSTDGKAWVNESTAALFAQSIVTNGDILVSFVYNDNPKYSSNGITWQKSNLSISSSSSMLTAYVNDAFFLFAGNSSLIYKSTDGINWTQGTGITASYSSQLWDITSNGNVYVGYGSGNVIWYSNDGIAWNYVNLGNEVSSRISQVLNVASNGDVFVLGTRMSSGYTPIGLYSADGQNWQQIDSSIQLQNVIFSKKQSLFVGYSTTTTPNEVYVSDNGTNWTTYSVSSDLSLNNLYERLKSQYGEVGDYVSLYFPQYFYQNEIITYNDSLFSNNEPIVVPIKQLDQQPAKIVTGSYVGTGTYGSDNPTTLLFPFMPKAVIIQQYFDTPNDSEVKYINDNVFTNYAVMINPAPSVMVGNPYQATTASGQFLLYLTWGANSVSWYTTQSSSTSYPSAKIQLNSGTYYYIAIG